MLFGLSSVVTMVSSLALFQACVLFTLASVTASAPVLAVTKDTRVGDLVVLGFGSWKPRDKVFVNYGESIVSAIGYDASYCIYWYPLSKEKNKPKFPSWAFNFTSIKQEENNGMPKVSNFYIAPSGNGFPNLLGAVSVLEWDVEMTANEKLSGLYRCSDPKKYKHILMKLIVENVPPSTPTPAAEQQDYLEYHPPFQTASF